MISVTLSLERITTKFFKRCCVQMLEMFTACDMFLMLQLKRVSILKKYDEEIEGEKKSSFELGWYSLPFFCVCVCMVHMYMYYLHVRLLYFVYPGTLGEVDTSEDRQRELVRQRLKEKEVSCL